jgi:two-component system, response regulator PdtaR
MEPARHGGASLRVLIVEDETLVSLGLKSLLVRLGHAVVGQAASASQAVDLFRAERPDLVLMDIRLEETDGIDLVTRFMAERRCPMVIISAYSDRELLERASAAGAYGYLIKPVSEPALAAQIEIAFSRFEEAERLRAEKDKLQHDLETRRLMDRAKAILMKRAGLSEDEAHRRLQQESQKRRMNLAELCRRIIDSDEVMGGGMP